MMAATNQVGFFDLKKGMTARIVAIDGCSCELTRLKEMGLTIGTRFKVIKVAPLGDPIEIDVRGYRLCLRKCETCQFEIELVD